MTLDKLNKLKQSIWEYENTNTAIDTIVQKYGIAKTTIYRHTSYRRGESNKGRIYNFNIQKIQKDSREKYYWLGFIAADGAVVDNCLSIELKDIDIEHLQKFNNFMENEHPLQTRINNQGVSCVKAIIWSCDLIKYLQNYNIVQNKSKTFVIPADKIPQYYIYDFVRGMIDGDGCIRINNHQQISLSFCSGNKIVCEQIKSILQIDNKISKDKNTYSFQVTGNIKAKKILDIIYKNSNERIRLDRKYNIYRSLIK